MKKCRNPRSILPGRSAESLVLTAACIVAFLTPGALLHANTSPKVCPTALGEAPDRSEIIRVMWFPKADFVWLAHSALEIKGEVFTTNQTYRRQASFETYLRNSKINTGFFSISIRVSREEQNELIKFLDANAGKMSFGNCANGLYKLLVRFGIMHGPTFPSRASILMMSKFALEKLYRNPRIAKIEWVGSRPRSLFPYLVGPSAEMAIIASQVYPVELVTTFVNELWIRQARDLYQSLMPLIH